MMTTCHGCEILARHTEIIVEDEAEASHLWERPETAQQIGGLYKGFNTI